MELKGRLKAIANMIDKCTILSDIGTDHAYIPIYLVEREKCQKAIAVDVRKGPVQIAAKNIEEAGLGHAISTRLADGLDGITAEEADVIVIAGMGGLLIMDIIGRNMPIARKAKSLILQPMNSVEYLREWLLNNGFQILDEELEMEEHKIYNILKVCYTAEIMEKFELGENIAGVKLIEKQHPLLSVYLKKKINTLSKVIEQQTNSINVREELEENKKLLEQLIKIRSRLI